MIGRFELVGADLISGVDIATVSGYLLCRQIQTDCRIDFAELDRKGSPTYPEPTTATVGICAPVANEVAVVLRARIRMVNWRKSS